MGDPLLSAFPPALLRLVLCGGRGLPVVWGPLARPLDGVWTWNPLTRRAIRPATIEQPAVLVQPDGWTLPLDHWRARLAVVAAWVLDLDLRFAPWVGRDGTTLFIAHVFISTAYRRHWDVQTGAYCGVFETFDLPTLPRHLLTHDPAAALLLALFDVPEIRAKVEALNG